MTSSSSTIIQQQIVLCNAYMHKTFRIHLFSFAQQSCQVLLAKMSTQTLAQSQEGLQTTRGNDSLLRCRLIFRCSWFSENFGTARLAYYPMNEYTLFFSEHPSEFTHERHSFLCGDTIMNAGYKYDHCFI